MLRLKRQSNTLQDSCMRELPGFLSPDDLLIFNDTQVINARLKGKKSTGGKVEILLERFVDEDKALVQMRASKTPSKRCRIDLLGGDYLHVLQKQDDLFMVKSNRNIQQIFSQHGEVPLPPYIQRAPNQADAETYQTVFARNPGAVAAPTAGLHFDQDLLNAIAERGIQWAFITLHIGLATFQPVRVEKIEQHRMHHEQMCIPIATRMKITQCRKNGGRIVAVGTTCVRCLESMANASQAADPAETDLFIYPGYRFKIVDAMLTNFHLPKSTLLMLVCAFAGKQQVLAAYQHAIKNDYRFYSYGDAMLVE